jgi:hypothetical protein
MIFTRVDRITIALFVMLLPFLARWFSMEAAGADVFHANAMALASVTLVNIVGGILYICEQFRPLLAPTKQDISVFTTRADAFLKPDEPTQ